MKCRQKPLHKKWFNASLQELRKSLDYYSKRLSFDPFNRHLRSKCFEFSKKYNRSRQKSKRLYFQNFMNKLDSLQENNPKLFWSLLNESKDKQKSSDACISEDSWLKHFKSMFSIQASNQNRVEEVTHILKSASLPPGDKELDKPVSQREIIKACNNLKNGKSCGLDGQRDIVF